MAIQISGTTVIDNSRNINAGITTVSAGTAGVPSITPTGDTNTGIFFPAADTVAISEGGTEALRVDSSGRLLVGTSNDLTSYFGGPSCKTVINADNALLLSTTSNAADSSVNINMGQNASQSGITLVTARISSTNNSAIDVTNGNSYGGDLRFSTRPANGGLTERMRITSGGSLLVGTTSANNAKVFRTFVGSESNSVVNEMVGDWGNSVAGSNTLLRLAANVASGNGATILLIEHTNPLAQADGFGIRIRGGFAQTAQNMFTQNTSYGDVMINRPLYDGTLIDFRHDNTSEGSISVSGTTVSYNGAHLSRWSQLASGAERIEILRGTVLSNLDEMCEWIDAPKEAVLWQEGEELPEGINVGDIKEPAFEGGPQDNEQLNRMKVSEVEGDKNVSGVFQCWDDGDNTYTNDFYCSMTGDFIIRIADGVTVERGDLLMSAGDGTAKPQDDDIIRSKTVAKVTSTNVTCTYDDGSYCVPCVLMAC